VSFLVVFVVFVVVMVDEGIVRQEIQAGLIFRTARQEVVPGTTDASGFTKPFEYRDA
jgi:hypothetical protein